MKRKILGIIFIICGILTMASAVVAEIAWLGVCFGTVIVGILMILFAPLLLVAPFTIIFGTGSLLWGNGLSMISED